MHIDILFLTLRIFSATGGIEKVGKVVCKALTDLSAGNQLGQLAVYSMYDETNEADEKYISKAIFKGFGQRKFQFVTASVKEGCATKVVILSHINLLVIGYLIKLFSPHTKLILIAHGIEVWEPLNVFKKQMLKKCDKILCVSEFTRQKMVDLFTLPMENLLVLNNCLDPFLLPEQKESKDEKLLSKLGFSNTDVVLMTLTRLSSKDLYKGYDQVLESIYLLKADYPSIKYLIVGKYDADEKQRIDRIVERLSLQQQVVFTGYIPDKELSRHYHVADLYIMPSKKEGFGIVFIEAMLYGLPVIAGNKDGSTDALLQGRLGVLIDPDNQEAITEAIKKVLLNPVAYRPNRQLLMQHFGFDIYKQQLQTILEEVTRS